MFTQLTAHKVAKPWGRDDLAPPFVNSGDTASEHIGELWYQSDNTNSNDPILIKYLFTSQKLSVQVHPDDAAARDQGHRSGKAECWYIVDAAPDAALGLGLKEEISAGELREASLSGTIEHMIDWKPTKAGDIWYVEPGTIHAIGPGVTLIEVQQNIDLTYRLYDYGRPRELHLDQAIAVATRAPYAMTNHGSYNRNEPLIRHWPHFGIALCDDENQVQELASTMATDSYWVAIQGDAQLDEQTLNHGQVYRRRAHTPLKHAELDDATCMLLAWPRTIDGGDTL
ncbi:class I mannose-6-phosphate isomerase [Alterisphingorhabdus coralli]|uniref:Class I mannose-6-phosphate isomerase n=1 Tax=Alterisphingorhabdus coralli TaxID=3071408 RepID=A0AA97F6F6_9SPHN|nr:class I mannose-6-phosphate isomerase [Parasphingorhabdus sp. SCSIO 66989]WOE74818.1 class I mannose-6-phosphate isomerase [Parasphingorhabdus sp. SCSIO 66989]